jgi:amino acid adenylation domain-containing protein
MSVETFVFPTSFAQRRLWLVNQLEPASPAYNVPIGQRFHGTLDVLALERALATIVTRHEALRTTFSLVDGEPVQVVTRDAALQLPVEDLVAMPAVDLEAEVQRLNDQEARHPFDLERGPLFRTRLLRLAPNEHALLLVVHHIVFDGWSVGVLFRELSECYRAFATGEAPRLPQLPVQYADYAVWQREWLTGGPGERQLDYWRAHLAGAPVVLELPTDFPRPLTRSYRGAAQRLLLSRRLLEGLKALSQEEGATLFMTLLAGFQLLLARYTRQDEIIVGSPIANRPRSELEHLIGFFVNSLALRTDLSGDPTFRQLLGRVRKVCLEAYEHQDLPFEQLVEELQPSRVGGRDPLYQVMFALQNTACSPLRLPGVTCRSLPQSTGTAKFDLTLNTQEDADGLLASLGYRSDLFEPGTIARMLGHWEKLLEGVVVNPDQRLSKIPLLLDDERRQVLVTWNQTGQGYPAGDCVHQLFEIQAAQRPEATAVEDGDERLTYGELNSRANQLARHLRKRGVNPEVRVAVALEPSADLVVALLAVLKAGGAYVPLDPSDPPRRLAFMLEDARVGVLVCDQVMSQPVPDGLASVNIDTDRDWIARESNQNLDSGTSAEHLAYVMYTSGSTGQPKGIAVPHRAITSLVRNTDYVQLTSADRVAQISNVSFDAATFEVWGALLNGGCLVLIPREVALSPQDCAAEIRERGITTLFLTTALFNQLASAVAEAFGSVRHVLFGGEAVDPRWVREVLEHGPPERLLHVYGPTETTTFATWHLVREISQGTLTVPIGRPIANTRAYVLDQQLEPMPVGVPGELYLGGLGLARGYLGQPALTAERFVPNPFGATAGESAGGRLYRTGDRVRWRSDGALEFLGRVDQQIKLRGFRVEPGEIEAALSRHPMVRECAVVVRDDLPGGRALVAYVVPGSPSARLVPEIRSYLRDRIPQYMIPAVFVVLDALPLSPNGKVARRALPPPNGVRPEQDVFFVPPRTPVEKALAGIWRELLGIDSVGMDDNFFDLGGHSLLALKLFAEIERIFERRLPLSTLFQAPTVGKLAEIIERGSGELDAGVVVLQAGRRYPPLFVVHGVDGHVMDYRELVSKLDPDQPVYGFEVPTGSNGEPVLSTVEELAARYLRQMRARQPVGPYFLCGYCWAGPLTFEMARQLRSAGEDVALLALIDAPYPGRHPGPLHRRIESQGMKIWRLTTQNLRRLAALKPKAVPSFLWERIVNIGIRISPVRAYRWSVRLGRPLLPAFRGVRGVLQHAGWSYRPRSYPGRIVLFRATASGAARGQDPDWGWSRLATGGVESHEVVGEHITIMQEPHVEGLSIQLSACLERARAGIHGKMRTQP